MDCYSELKRLESLAFAKSMLKFFGFPENKIVEDNSMCDKPNAEWALYINGEFIIYFHDSIFEVQVCSKDDYFEVGQHDDVKKAVTQVAALDINNTVERIQDNFADSFNAWETIGEDEFLQSIGVNKYAGLNDSF